MGCDLHNPLRNGRFTSTRDVALCLKCANSGHTRTVWRTGQVDPKSTFRPLACALLPPAQSRSIKKRCLPRQLCYSADRVRTRHGGKAENRGDPGRGYCRLQPARCRRRGSHSVSAQGLKKRSDRPDAHHGRIVKRTGDGSIIEFRSVVDAVRCAIEVQTGLAERNAGLPPERRIEFRIGVHLGDVVEETDGDLMGDGVNIAARLEGIAKPGRSVCPRTPIVRSRGGSISRSAISARPNSRTSPTRSAFIRCKSARPP